jgi:TPR repeat protein
LAASLAVLKSLVLEQVPIAWNRQAIHHARQTLQSMLMNPSSPKRNQGTADYVMNLAKIGAQSASARVGRPRQQDLLKAFQFYSQAAQYGHAGANYELGVMYDQGVLGVVEEDPLKAALCYGAAADGGMAAAKFNLAFLYEKGRGVTQNVARALTLWEGASALNHSKVRKSTVLKSCR